MNLLERWRPFFLARSRREKLLAALFLVALALLWAGTLSNRWRRFAGTFAAMQQRSHEQTEVLGRQAEIEARYDAALARLDRDLPAGADVYARLEDLTRSHFNPFPRMPALQPEVKERLIFNRISVSPQRAQWSQLYSFFQDVSRQLPTVKLAEVRLATERPAPGVDQISASFVFVAIEIKR